MRESISSCRTYVGVCRARTTAVSRCSIYHRRRVKNLRRCEYSACSRQSHFSFTAPVRIYGALSATNFRCVCFPCVKEHNPGKHGRRREGEPCGLAICELPWAFDNRLVIEENCYRHSCAAELSFPVLLPNPCLNASRRRVESADELLERVVSVKTAEWSVLLGSQDSKR